MHTCHLASAGLVSQMMILGVLPNLNFPGSCNSVDL